MAMQQPQEWNKENQNDAEAVFGVEDVFKRDPNGGNSGWGVSQGRFGIQFEQWTLAGAPNHPVYCNMHNFIRCAQLVNAQPTLPSGCNGLQLMLCHDGHLALLAQAACCHARWSIPGVISMKCCGLIVLQSAYH